MMEVEWILRDSEGQGSVHRGNESSGHSLASGEARYGGGGATAAADGQKRQSTPQPQKAAHEPPEGRLHPARIAAIKPRVQASKAQRMRDL